MLPAAARLRRPADFTATLRAGRRAGRPTLVVSLLPPAERDGSPRKPARVGFVVGRTVGGAVLRNRVSRRLRHLMANRLAQLPEGARLVVRALPPAAAADSAALGLDLDAALRRLAGTRS
ncbi:MAG: ribonuclease P protein component [Actinomycetota bacterium]|nr:ribonuclease P protein component [Actinomycetota bacterium]